MKINYETLTHLELDALKEIGNIGAAHAATALSQITGETVLIGVSKVGILPVSEIPQILGSPKERAAAVHMKLLGDLTGGIVLILPWANALILADILKKEPPGASRELLEMEVSSLKEAGTILTAAYFRAIGKMMKMSLVPSAAELSWGEIANVLERILGELSRITEIAFCIETEFIESSLKIKGHFLLVPDRNSLDRILRALGLVKEER